MLRKGIDMNKFLTGFDNQTLTENGALTYKSTLNANLDYFATVAAARNRNTLPLFEKAYAEDEQLALRNLFHLRDIRGGKGERQTFRNHLRWLYDNHRNMFHQVLEYIPEYGRWDDILEYADDTAVQLFVGSVLETDIVNMAKNQPVSLLAKWMPSENASSKETKRAALQWCQKLGMTIREYRKTLSALRAYLRIVERAMSANEFGSIEYDQVPSQAMTRYRRSFSKRDPERFVAYLEAVKKGEKKINAATLTPDKLADIIFNSQGDDVAEAQWDALPVYIQESESFLVCPDVSGSMGLLGRGNPLSMSIGLALYCSQFAKGEFKDKILSFTDRPTLYNISHLSLKDKINVVNSHTGYSTNLYGMFQEIVRTAIAHRVPQSDMPTRLLIITDMEFNDTQVGMTNLETAKLLFKSAGYTAPKIVFWNVNSRKNNVGALAEDEDVILVSGNTPAVLKAALAGTDMEAITPEQVMLETLNSDRYERIIV
jgi:hypothetical protein